MLYIGCKTFFFFILFVSSRILCNFATLFGVKPCEAGVDRGDDVPYFCIFIVFMIDKEFVRKEVEKELAGGDLFLVDVKVGRNNEIGIFIDGDRGVTIQDCVDLSRAIENKLDREKEDFELNVSSCGIEEPLKLKRQYLKNIGRQIEVENIEGKKFSGLLAEVDEDGFSVVCKVGKGRTKEEVKRVFGFDAIKTSRIVISFK